MDRWRIRMKRVFQMIGISLMVIIITYGFVFLFLFSLLNIFVNFRLLAEKVALYVALGLSGAFAILALVFLILYWKSSKSTKFGNWLRQRFPKTLLFYIIAVIICLSIREEIILSFDNMKDMISIEWGIFGISVTVFLVWNVVILQYLKSNKPIKSEKSSLIKTWNYIENKGDFNFKASLLFNSATLLIINVFVLIWATTGLFITQDINTLLTQNTIIVSFYFSTNTLICLFMDIIGLFIIDKKEIMNDTKVTSEEIDFKNRINVVVNNILSLLLKVDTDKNLDEDKKKELKDELLQDITEKLYEPFEIEKSTENNHHD